MSPVAVFFGTPFIKVAIHTRGIKLIYYWAQFIYNDYFRNELSLFWKHSDLAENARETRLNSCLRRGRLNHPKANKVLLNKRIILAIILLSLDLSTLQNHLHFLLSSYKKNHQTSIESDILLPFFYYHRQR